MTSARQYGSGSAEALCVCSGESGLMSGERGMAWERGWEGKESASPR